MFVLAEAGTEDEQGVKLSERIRFKAENGQGTHRNGLRGIRVVRYDS